MFNFKKTSKDTPSVWTPGEEQTPEEAAAAADPSPMRFDICKYCWWFKPVKDGKGECRLNAPRASNIPLMDTEGNRKGTAIMNFPIVKEIDFCGKWSINNGAIAKAIEEAKNV